MAEELERALREVRETLLVQPVSPRVEEPADINLHFCRHVAETVAERLGDGYGIDVLADGGRGFVHTWIAYEGRHYDAECVEGVRDHRDLPFFERHPEAAVHVEPGTADPASLRRRGRGSLYPAMSAPEPPDGSNRAVRATDRKLAVGGMFVGLLVFAVGVCGEWAVQGQLVAGLARYQTVFVGLEIVGELVALVSPVVFAVLRPAYRASSR